MSKGNDALQPLFRNKIVAPYQMLFVIETRCKKHVPH